MPRALVRCAQLSAVGPYVMLMLLSEADGAMQPQVWIAEVTVGGAALLPAWQLWQLWSKRWQLWPAACPSEHLLHACHLCTARTVLHVYCLHCTACVLPAGGPEQPVLAQQHEPEQHHHILLLLPALGVRGAWGFVYMLAPGFRNAWLCIAEAHCAACACACCRYATAALNVVETVGGQQEEVWAARDSTSSKCSL
jgi:hypothetical protein